MTSCDVSRTEPRRPTSEMRHINVTATEILERYNGEINDQGSGAHPASYPVGTRGSFPGDKAGGTWSW